MSPRLLQYVCSADVGVPGATKDIKSETKTSMSPLLEARPYNGEPTAASRKLGAATRK